MTFTKVRLLAVSMIIALISSLGIVGASPASAHADNYCGHGQVTHWVAMWGFFPARHGVTFQKHWNDNMGHWHQVYVSAGALYSGYSTYRC